MRILITKPFWLSDSPQWRFRQYLYRYLKQTGHQPVLEGLHEQANWAGYDAVFVSPYTVDLANPYCKHILAQMQLSMGTNQQRWVMDDDEYFIVTPLLSLPGEYTHRLRMPQQPLNDWPSCKQEGEVLRGDWYRYHDFELVLHAKSLLKRHTPAKYFGNLKQDRIDSLAEFSIECVKCDSYTDFLARASASTAQVMLSSKSHNGSVTVRLGETMLLSIALFHSSYFAEGFTPRADRVFNTPAELDAIMAELHAQTPAERQAELMQQYALLQEFTFAKVR